MSCPTAGSSSPGTSSVTSSTIRVSTWATPGISASRSISDIGRPLHAGEHVGEAVALVECRPRQLQRMQNRPRIDERRHAGRDHDRDRKRLPLHLRQVAKQLAIEGADHGKDAGCRMREVRETVIRHANACTSVGNLVPMQFDSSLSPRPHPASCSPRQLARRALRRIAMHVHDLAVGNRNHAVGHVGDHGVVRDDGRRRAQFAVDPRNRLQHQNARVHVERPGRLVAQQHGRVLGDGPGDRHALLLAAGKLRRKVVLAARPDSPAPSASVGFIGFERDVGHQRHVFAGRQAGNQIVELKHEADVLAAIARQGRVVELGELAGRDRTRCRRWARRARPEY